MIEQVQPVRHDPAAIIAAHSPSRRPFLDRVAHTTHTRFGCQTDGAQLLAADDDGLPTHPWYPWRDQCATEGGAASRRAHVARRVVWRLA
jgi:hypothetical protein